MCPWRPPMALESVRYWNVLPRERQAVDMPCLVPTLREGTYIRTLRVLSNAVTQSVETSIPTRSVGTRTSTITDSVMRSMTYWAQ